MSQQRWRWAISGRVRPAIPGGDFRPILRALTGTAGDAILVLLIMVAALLVWSPATGLRAARDSVATRRNQRRREEILRQSGEIWLRHARRQRPPGFFGSSPARVRTGRREP